MKFFLTFISVLLLIRLPAQTLPLKPAILTGFNISSLRTDSISNESAFLPFVYLGLTKIIDEKTSFSGSAGYSIKGGNVMTPFSKYRFQYIDFQASGTYHFSDLFSFDAGLQPSFLLSSRYLIGTDSVVDLNLKKWGTELSAFAGLNFHFQGDVSLGIHYFLPIRNVQCNQIQIVLNIPISGTMEKIEEKKTENIAYQHIADLKEGALLVRLKTSENIIGHLEKEGKNTEAEKIKNLQKAENLEIVNSFKKYFHFCPVYFFYSKNTDLALSGNFSGILLNDSLEVDSTLKIPSGNYYFAEFGLLDLNNEGSTGTGIEALIIKDKNMNQLERPFPFYVRKNEFLAGSKNISQVVNLLNFNLEQFYKTALSELKR